MQTLQVDDVYATSEEATANVFSWKNAGKLGDARGKVQEVRSSIQTSSTILIISNPG
jgi:hypothetical protein